MKLLIRSGANIQISIIIMILLTVMNLSGIVKILVMVTVIYGTKNTPYHPPKFFVLYIAGQLQFVLEYDMLIVHGVMLKQSNQEIDHLLAVTSQRSRLFCIHLLVLKNKVFEGLYITQIVNIVHTVTLGMMSTTPLNINYTNGVLRSCSRIQIKQ